MLEVLHEGCVGHGIHLVVGAFLSVTNEEESVDAADYPPVDLTDEEFDLATIEQQLASTFRVIVLKLKKIATYLKNSPKGMTKFLVYAKAQQMMEGTEGEVSFILGVKTRWNSTYCMLVRFIKWQQSIDQFTT